MIITKTTRKLLVPIVLLLPGLALATSNVSPADIDDDPFPFYPDEGLPVQVEDRFPPVIYEPGHELNNTVPWKTPLIAFDPKRTYTPEEQRMIMDDEQRLTEATRQTVAVPPPPGVAGDYTEEYELGIDQTVPAPSPNPASLPLENFNPASLVEPGQQPGRNLTPANQRLNQSFTPLEQRFGNDIFGAGYRMSTSITSHELSNGNSFDARADFTVYATAFSLKRDIFRATAAASSTPTSNTCNATIYVMGTNVWNRSGSTELTAERTPWSRNFFRAQRRFMVGPVPVRVEASITGEVGIVVSASAGYAGVALNATPRGVATASISAGVDAIVVGFGFGGSLTLISISTAYTHDIRLNPFVSNGLSWQFTVNRNINTIAGRIYLYAVVRFLWFRQRWELDIANWRGLNYNYPLVNLRYPPSRASVSAASVSRPVP
jgi:hypothetical protein